MWPNLLPTVFAREQDLERSLFVRCPEAVRVAQSQGVSCDIVEMVESVKYWSNVVENR